MKNLTLIIYCILSSYFSQAQNLVPNPSFEDTIACPDGTDQMYKCAEWWSAGMPGCSSPDYFHGCSSVNTISPPEVAWGNQIPVSGVAYGYVITYFLYPNPCFGREYIQSQLLSPLVTGQKYFISFYANLGGRGGVTIASNKLGALFTTYTFTSSDYAQPINFAHVYTDSILADTINWVQLRFSFVADSSYKFITIGNFFDDASTDTMIIQIDVPNTSGYFIDNVCVSTDSVLCNDLSNVHENILENNIIIFPNPSTNIINISSEDFIHELTIYDVFGKKLFENVNSGNKNIIINTSNWSSGLYFIKINSQLFKQLIINH